jgi:hypothetical protein
VVGVDPGSGASADRGGVPGKRAASGLKIRPARVRGRTLVPRLSSAGARALRVSVRRAGRTVARGRVAGVRPGVRTVRVRLNRSLRPAATRSA